MSTLKNKISFKYSYMQIIGAIILLLFALVLLWHGNATSNRAMNAISAQVYFEGEYRIADGAWQTLFTECPPVFTAEEKKAYLATKTGVALGSDAFFPFSDNIDRAHRSGVSYVAQPGGSIRDQIVIDACDKYGMVMAFTGLRLFHH